MCPDLTIEHYRWCQANECWSKIITGSKDQVYRVSFDPRMYFETDGWHCTCKGFRFRHDCKHVKQAKTEKCSYSEGSAWACPEPEDSYIGPLHLCPKCGGATSIVKVAV